MCASRGRHHVLNVGSGSSAHALYSATTIIAAGDVDVTPLGVVPIFVRIWRAKCISFPVSVQARRQLQMSLRSVPSYLQAVLSIHLSNSLSHYSYQLHRGWTAYRKCALCQPNANASRNQQMMCSLSAVGQWWRYIDF